MIGATISHYKMLERLGGEAAGASSTRPRAPI
jgi:hypothetical protein